MHYITMCSNNVAHMGCFYDKKAGEKPSGPARRSTVEGWVVVGLEAVPRGQVTGCGPV